MFRYNNVRFVKDDFMKFFKMEIQKDQHKGLNKVQDKIVLAKSSTGYLNSLMEILQEPNIQNRLQNTKFTFTIDYKGSR